MMNPSKHELEHPSGGRPEKSISASFFRVLAVLYLTIGLALIVGGVFSWKLLLSKEDAFSKWTTVQPSPSFPHPVPEHVRAVQNKNASARSLITEVAIKSEEAQIYPGMRVIVVAPSLRVPRDSGQADVFKLGETFKVRAVRKDGRLLVGTINGEGYLPRQHVMPIHQSFEYLENLVASEPENSRAHTALGIAWYYIEPKKALEHLTKAIILDPSDPLPYSYRCGDHMWFTDPSEYRKDVQKGLDLGKSDSQILCRMANSGFERAYWLKANDVIKLAEQAIEITPKYGAPYVILGRIHARSTSGSNPRLLEAAKDGLLVDPTNPSLHNLRGLYYLRRAQELANLGQTAHAVKAFSEADQAFNQATHFDPFNARYHYNKSLASLNAGLRLEKTAPIDHGGKIQLGLVQLSESLFRDWRYAKALDELSTQLGGSQKRSARSDFHHWASSLDLDDEYSRIMLWRLKAILELDPMQVKQGMWLVEGLDFAQTPLEAVRVPTAMHESHLAIMVSNDSRPCNRAFHCGKSWSWPNLVPYHRRSDGLSALSLLCEGYPDAAMWAIINGADPNFANKDGSRPIHSVIGHQDIPWTLLHLLLVSGANPNPALRKGEQSPLATCLKKGDFVSVLILRKAGAAWGEAGEESSALAVINSMKEGNTVIQNEKSADQWAMEKCTHYIVQQIRSTTANHRKAMSVIEEPLTKPTFTETPDTDGLGFREIANAHREWFKRFEADSAMYKTLSRRREIAVELLKKDAESRHEIHRNALFDWACLLLPDDGIKSVRDAIDFKSDTRKEKTE